MTNTIEENVQRALWAIYHRSQPPIPWRDGDNLPWDDPDFSERMLREHLDQSHGAASRQEAEILHLVNWQWEHLRLQPGSRLLDITCGPGLYAVEFARRGAVVTGIDFGPASIRHARDLANQRHLDDRCTFIQADVRSALSTQVEAAYDAALFIYGQLSVFTREQAAQLLRRTAAALKPGGRLVVELLAYDRIDKSAKTWWFTDDAGLWGNTPFLHLGERSWDNEQRASIDRFFIIDLQSGQLQTIGLSDNAYETEEFLRILQDAGFHQAWAYPAWDGLALYDAQEWVAYVAER
jgi:SAM-dependent methyltransferase